MRFAPIVPILFLLACSSTEPEPEPGSVRVAVEYCWNASCDPWRWGGEATLTGSELNRSTDFSIGTTWFREVPHGTYTLLVDSSTTLRFGALVCIPKFTPERVEVVAGEETRVIISAQLACR